MDELISAIPKHTLLKEGYKRLDYMIMITYEDDVNNWIK